MDKITAVACREFIATVRTRAFVLTVVVMPMLMVCGLYGFEYVEELTKEQELPSRKLALVDYTDVLADVFAAQIAAHNDELPGQPFELEVLDELEPDREEVKEGLTKRVQDGELYGWLVVSADTLNPDGEGQVELARSDTQLSVGRRLERMVNNAVVAVRFERAGIDAALIARQRTPVRFAMVDARSGESFGSDTLAQIMTPFVFMLLMFMGTFGIAQGLLTTVIEEKSSRVVEVLLSAVSPLQLMAGKIIGMVCVGVLLLSVWGGVSYFGARSYNMEELVTPYRLTIAGLYFVPGFLLMASILAGVGSACNELKEAQSMVFPLSILTIIPMIFWFFIAEYPASPFSIILSYIPPITPFIMILRICSDPATPMWQIVSTQVVLWASVLVAMWAAAKVFRVGVLMYGKPPSPRELLRWLRYS